MKRWIVAVASTGLALASAAFAQSPDLHDAEKRACASKDAPEISVLVAEPRKLDLSPFESLSPAETLEWVVMDRAGELPDLSAELRDSMLATIGLCARLDFVEMRTDEIDALISDSGCLPLLDLLRGGPSVEGSQRAEEKGTHTIGPWGFVTCRSYGTCHTTCGTACYDSRTGQYNGQDHFLFINDSGSPKTCTDWGNVNGYPTCMSGVLWWMASTGSSTRTCWCV